MQALQAQPQKKTALYALFAINFLLTLNYALPVYINSTFLAQFTTEKLVGLLYTIGSVIAVLAFVGTPAVLRRYGAYRTTFWLFILQALATLGLAYFRSLLFIAPVFIATLALLRIIGLNLDEMLEHYTKNHETGRVRGVFLSIANAAVMISPLIAGFIVGSDEYWRIYLLAALTITPILALFTTYFAAFKDPDYNRTPFWATLRIIWKRKNVRRILMSNMMLRLFFSWMVIYTPIYLNQHIGFGWDTIGIMFTIMLLPYVLFEFPLGRLADTRYGEKEILSAGYVIAAVSTAALSFIVGASFLAWTVVLVATRIGGAAIEIMNETYFFKKINDEDSNILSFFRMVQPLAYVIGPLIASASLFFVDIKYSFLIFGIIMLWGLRYSLTLKDTL